MEKNVELRGNLTSGVFPRHGGKLGTISYWWIQISCTLKYILVHIYNKLKTLFCAFDYINIFIHFSIL